MEIYGAGMLNLGYLGGVYDAGTGLIYMGNGQYYDPTTGSILTKNINSNQSNIPLNSNPSYFVISPILLLSLFFRNKKEKNNKWFAMVLLILLVSLFICMNFMLLGSVSDNVFATYNTPTLKPTWSYSDYFYPNPEINPNLPPEIKDQVIADIIYMNEVEQICTKLAEYHFPYPDVFPDKTPIEIFKDSCWQKIMFEYFRTDNKESPIYDSWSNEDWNLKQIHSARIINLMMHYQGEKWWEGDVPTTSAKSGACRTVIPEHVAQ